MLVWAVVLVNAIVVLAQEKPGPPPEAHEAPEQARARKEKREQRADRAEDVAKRAWARARKTGRSFARVTLAPDDANDDAEAVLAFVEFTTGDVGVFSGVPASDQDQFLIVDKGSLEILDEVVTRCLKKK